MFTRVAEPDATIISIDLLGGRSGGGYPKWKIPLFLPCGYILIKEKVINLEEIEKSKSL